MKRYFDYLIAGLLLVWVLFLAQSLVFAGDTATSLGGTAGGIVNGGTVDIEQDSATMSNMFNFPTFVPDTDNMGGELTYTVPYDATYAYFRQWSPSISLNGASKIGWQILQTYPTSTLYSVTAAVTVLPMHVGHFNLYASVFPNSVTGINTYAAGAAAGENIPKQPFINLGQANTQTLQWNDVNGYAVARFVYDATIDEITTTVRPLSQYKLRYRLLKP